MKLIIGLGNPGRTYKKTRHNIGFMVLDEFAKQEKLKFKYNNEIKAEIIETNLYGQKTILLKPFTYMNLSGESVVQVVNYYSVKLEDILVIVDDMALPIGKLRMREFGSDGGHNGLKNINKHLNSDRYKRIRIGIGENTYDDSKSYVLGKFSRAEIKALEDSIIDATGAITMFLKEVPYLDIMTRYNTNHK